MDGIRWIADEDLFEFGYWVVFARDTSASDLLARVGGGTAERDASLLTRVEANERADESDGVALRSGQANGWGFLMAEGGPVRVSSPEDLSRISSGTEVIEFWCTVNSDMMFTYAQSGTVVCRFEPGREHESEGAAPDLLIPALGDSGLDPEMRVLSMMESRFGIDLSQSDVLEGRLLSVTIPS